MRTSIQSKFISFGLLTIMMALFLGACKEKEQVMMLAEDKPVPEEAEIQLEIPVPQDSLSILYQRTACFGTCPIFVLKIYKSGYATYEGTNFVEMMGKFDGYAPQGALEAVMAQANGIGYFNMQDRYDAMVSDLPSIITEITGPNGNRKRVNNRYGGPKSLQDLYPILDHVIESTEWKPIKKQ